MLWAVSWRWLLGSTFCMRQAVFSRSTFVSPLSGRSKLSRASIPYFFHCLFLRFFLTGLLIFLGTTGLLPAEDVVPESTPAAQAATQEQPLNIDIPTVEGQDVLGIRIPHHDETGKLVFQLSAEKARRLNDQDVEMEDMELIFYDEQDQKFEVLIPLSTFNLESKQLHGDSGATISREDFTIEGEVIDFDLAKQSGVLRGDVTMTIHQTDSLEP